MSGPYSRIEEPAATLGRARDGIVGFLKIET
jgi:hypothetical protein